jgi:hypothetical protein
VTDLIHTAVTPTAGYNCYSYCKTLCSIYVTILKERGNLFRQIHKVKRKEKSRFMSDNAGKSGNYVANFILAFGFDMGFWCITINHLLILVCPLYEFVPV